MTEVLPPHGFAKLIDWHGDERAIVNAARVSFHKEVEEMGDGDKGLIRFLLKNKHGSPFEQGFQSSWHIRMPIFVAREWVRHRIGYSYNEESGRYVELRPDFYIPQLGDVREQKGKPGNYTFETTDSFIAELFCERLAMSSQDAYEDYQWALKAGIAKEQARLFLPVNLYTEIRWTANARSLLNFFELRSSNDAMKEIRAYSWALENEFAEHMPTVYKAFLENGRVAP